jgi:hypothetical protein
MSKASQFISNAGMDRQRQLETPLQKSTHENGNGIRRRRRRKKCLK